MNAASIKTKAAVKNVCMAYDIWALINAITKLQHVNPIIDL